MRNRILELLSKKSGQNTSGVEISNYLGISRVAVWKHIKKLIQEGYEIESSKKGYYLNYSGDIIKLMETRKDLNLLFFPNVTSTMDKAREIAINQEHDFSIVIAENQTKGRGRLDRIWNSPKGGLWFTMILKPGIPAQLAFTINFSASVALVNTLKNLFSINPKVKWPNDIYLDNGKLAGILSEMETRGDMISYTNTGIGINVNNTLPLSESKAVSICEITGAEASRKQILISFIEEFRKILKNPDSGEIIKLWKNETSTIGKDVRVETLGNVFTGRAVDVDETGALVLEDKNGELKRIIYGDCFYNN